MCSRAVAWRRLDAVDDLDALDQELPEPKADWLRHQAGTRAVDPRPSGPPPPLRDRQRPVRLPHQRQPQFTQLRRDAETAIQAKNWEEAISLLKLGVIMRPTHRNVARRLKAVSTGNRLIRSLLLIVSYRNVG